MTESDAFWPELQAEAEALGFPQRFCSLNLEGSSVAAAARPGLAHRLHRRPRRAGPASTVAAAAYAILGGAFAFLLARTQSRAPLFPLSPDAVEWSREWLAAAAADYYGVCFCLCGVIVCSEPLGQAFCWSLGCCVLGTPVCCLYVAAHLFRHGTLCLRRLNDR